MTRHAVPPILIESVCPKLHVLLVEGLDCWPGARDRPRPLLSSRFYFSCYSYFHQAAAGYDVACRERCSSARLSSEGDGLDEHYQFPQSAAAGGDMLLLLLLWACPGDGVMGA